MCLSSTKSSSSTNWTDQPSWVTNQATQIYGAAKAAAMGPNSNTAPQRGVAELGSDYGKASAMLNSMAGSPNADYGTARSTFKSLLAADNPNATVQDYMNPYISAVLTPQIREMMENGQLARNQINAQAAMDGAYGDARSGFQLAEQMRREQQNIGDTTGKAYAAAFDNATAARAAALQRLLATGNAIEGLGSAEDQRTSGIAQLLASLALQKQGVDQKGQDIAYQNALAQKQLPYQNALYMMQMLGAAPKSTISGGTSTSTSPDNSLMELVGKIAGSFLTPAPTG